MVVREATLADLDWIVSELRAFSEFITFKHKVFPRDEALMRHKLSLLITEQFVRIAEIEEGGTRVGFIAGVLAPHWFNPEIFIFTEMFWWVRPEHRGSSAGARLLDALIKYGDQVAEWIVLGLEHNSPIKDETIFRHGFQIYERSFLKENVIPPIPTEPQERSA